MTTFKECVENELRKLKDKTRYKRQNLTHQEIRVLKELQAENIIICPADKGGAIVVQDSTKYNLECLRQLSDQTYQKLAIEPTKNFHEELVDLCEIGDEFGYIMNNNPRIPMFYCVPKAHKNTIHPAAQLSGIGSLTANLSHYIDLLLQPGVKNIPSYTKDTTQILKIGLKFEGSWIMG